SVRSLFNVSVPIAAVPGASVAPAAMETGPAIEPLPPRVPPVAVTPTTPLAVLTSNTPLETDIVPFIALLSPVNVNVPLPSWVRSPMPLIGVERVRFAAELNATAPPLIARLAHELVLPPRINAPPPNFVRLKL